MACVLVAQIWKIDGADGAALVQVGEEFKEDELLLLLCSGALVGVGVGVGEVEGQPPVSQNCAKYGRPTPPILLKLPPTYKVEPDKVRTLTLLSALGSQVVARPVVVSKAAIRFLGCPPILLNHPPT